MNKESGQVGVLHISSIGISIVIALAGFWLAQSNRTDGKIDAVKVEMGENSERSDKLEEAISTLKSDNMEIKKDLKIILQKLK